MAHARTPVRCTCSHGEECCPRGGYPSSRVGGAADDSRGRVPECEFTPLCTGPWACQDGRRQLPRYTPYPHSQRGATAPAACDGARGPAVQIGPYGAFVSGVARRRSVALRGM